MRQRFENQVFYRELTTAGIVLCAFLGLGIVIILFTLIGLQAMEVPIVILGYLWFLAGILASGVLKAAARFLDWLQERPFFRVLNTVLRVESFYAKISVASRMRNDDYKKEITFSANHKKQIGV
ncbi:MAG: hypothetical protein LUH20_00590 [Lachnospiraceae bacterium]|nr:hypothetical protein [Lachnospiraceae bacterium]